MLTTQDGKTINAYRAGQGNAKGLVVLQEIFGVNAHIRETADKFAAQGYDVIAPALFDRATPNVELAYSPADVQEGLKLRSQIPLEDTLFDIQAAIDALGDKPVAIVGYCWGGTLSWQAACKLKGLKAASCWYPGGIAQVKDLKPAIPVQVHFGEHDSSIPMDDVKAFSEAQPQVDVYIYENAQHGFGCDQRASFNPTAYKLALQRTLDFFAEKLE